MKKISMTLVILMVVVTLLSACNNSEQKTAKPDEHQENTVNDNEDKEDVAEIELLMWTLTSVPTDLNKVQEAINEISREKINTEVHINMVDMATYIQQVNLMISSGEKLDLMVTLPGGSAHFSAMSSQKQLTSLNELLPTYAPEMMALIPEDWLVATTYNGQLYAIPSYSDKASDFYYMCRSDILEEVGINADSIRSTDDIDILLAAVKERHPEMVGITGGARNLMTFPGYSLSGSFEEMDKFDALGDTGLSLAVVFYDNPYEVVNYYESDSWKETVALAAEWYNKGYIDKDISTREDAATSIMSGGNAFSFFNELSFGGEKVVSNTVGYDLTAIKVADSTIGTSQLRKFTWAIPTTSTEPEAAAKFMNLLYTDEAIMNLFAWGIEGEHYIVNEDGTISFPEGIDSDNSGYYIGDVTSIVGNGFLTKVFNGQDPELRALVKEKNDTAAVSPLNGFSFDTSELVNEYTALNSVIETYRSTLRAGFYTEELQAEFEEKLKSAGADAFVAAAQKQLDAWLEAVN